MRVLLDLVTCVFLSVACEGASSPMSKSPAATTNSAFARAATAAHVVFEGEVRALGPTPGVWSGRFAAYQTVTYRVTKIVSDPGKRLSADAEVTVQHVLVAGSETADVQPQLRPALVAVGATVIVLANLNDGRWTGLDEHHGIVAADAEHRAALAGR